jgi:hypothetical protein
VFQQAVLGRDFRSRPGSTFATLCAVALACAVFVPGGSEAESGAEDPRGHCVVYVNADSHGGGSRSGGCFGTAAHARRAVRAERGDRTRIGRACDGYIRHDDPRPCITWFGRHGRCDANTKYSDAWFGPWNDRISTAIGYGKCKFVLFEHRNFGGGRIVCGYSDRPQPNPNGWCVSMSSHFDNKTSSARWRAKRN